MRLRTRLTLTMAGLVALTCGLLGYGVIARAKASNDRDARERIGQIESYVQKAALDALVQRDDLILVSAMKFLRDLHPALAYAEIGWEAGGRERVVTVGERPKAVIERRLSVADPGDRTRRVSVALLIDKAFVDDILRQRWRRLIDTMAYLGLGIVLLGVALALWLAHSITAPVKRLEALAADIASGKLGARMEYESDDEIGSLVRSFNQMSHRLEELDEIKKNFVSSVTHELRSPLGAMESFLGLIQGKLSSPAPEVKDYLNRIQVNIQRLSRFINDLLDVAKIEKGKMECTLRPMKLHEVAVEVCEFFGPKAQQQAVALGADLESLPPIMGDAERLRQVLINLVSNSLKFTPNGGRIRIRGDQFRENGKKWVEITVEDTGRGMSPQDVQKLFQAFSQGGNISDRVGGNRGTGLGLYITKSIVSQHGGKIDVKSALGQGTAISFSLTAA